MVVVSFESVFVCYKSPILRQHGDHFKYNTCSLVSAMILYRRMALFILSVGFTEITDKKQTLI